MFFYKNYATTNLLGHLPFAKTALLKSPRSFVFYQDFYDQISWEI